MEDFYWCTIGHIYKVLVLNIKPAVITCLVKWSSCGFEVNLSSNIFSISGLLSSAECINQLNTDFCILPEYLDIVTPDDDIPSTRCS